MSAEAKVGLLVVFCAILAIATGLFLTDMLGRWGAQIVTVQFEDVQGLAPGAQVRLGGVAIGKVTEVALKPHASYPDKPAAVKAQMHRDVILYDTDTFEIKQGAVVGDKYVAVTRAQRQKPRQPLESGAVVGGAGASSAEVIMDETRALVAAARATVDAVQSVAGDQQTQEDLRETIANLNRATARAVIVAEQTIELASTLNRTGQASSGKIDRLMTHLVGAADTVETMATRVDNMLEVSPVPAQLAMAGENIRTASEDVAALVEHTRTTVEDEDMAGQMAETVANLTEASENIRAATQDIAGLTSDDDLMSDIRETMTNVRDATDSLRSAAEAAEELITDEQTQEDLRATIGNFRQTSESTVTAVERATEIMDDVQDTMETVRSTQSIVSDIEGTPVFDFRLADGGEARADAYLDLRLSPDAPDHVRVGMRDIGDGETISLLWRHPIGRHLISAGLIGSELGLAWERSLGGSRAVEAELYDPNDLRLDVGMRWGLWKHYYLLLGAQRVGDGNNPYLGVRYQKGF